MRVIEKNIGMQSGWKEFPGLEKGEFRGMIPIPVKGKGQGKGKGH